MNIFSHNYVKGYKDKTHEYKFGFSYLSNVYILKVFERGDKYSM